MKKILIATTDYPNNEGGRKLFYVHVRSIYYKKQNIDLEVLNFNAKYSYEFEGVKVITLKEFKRKYKEEEYKLLICHAPNLKKHFLFIKKYSSVFNDNIVFFFHGHEIIRISNHYPVPFDFNTKGKLIFELGKIYDLFKIRIWKRLFRKFKENFTFIFVSSFLKKICIEDFRVEENFFVNSYIIPNSVGIYFQENNYQNYDQQYDFITIRNNYDSSTYSIDLVNEIAKNNSGFRFCVIGKGNFFNHKMKSNNLEIVNRDLTHQEILGFLDSSKYALMPTRHDSQGVMSCECATYGIPVITSDIEVCREIFEGFDNVDLVPNEKITEIDFSTYKFPNITNKKNKKYFDENTVKHEVALLTALLREVENQL